MFGIKRNEIKERIRKALVPIYERRAAVEIKVSAIEDGGERIHTDINQVADNTIDLTIYAEQNVEVETALLHSMNEMAKIMKTSAEEYAQITDMEKICHEAVMKLVEDNKHYTTPAKYLTEIPSVLSQNYQSQEEKLDALSEYERQLAALVLEAAAKENQMSENGEEKEILRKIKRISSEYEKTTSAMKEELNEVQRKNKELEENVLRLVALIKEGNVHTARLMKKSGQLNKMLEKSSIRDFSEDMISMRDKVVSMRNLDEEITKSGRRNKIQMDDIQDEIQTQKKNMDELESDLSYMFYRIKERMEG